MLKGQLSSFGPQLKIIEIYYYAKVLKEEKRNKNIDHPKKFYVYA